MLKHIRAVMSFILPGGMLLLASLVLVRLHGFQNNLDTILGIYPYVTYPVAFVLGWRFNRSALVFGAAAIAMAHWCLMWFGPGHGFSQVYWRVAYVSASILLPINLLVLSLAKERGIFTPRGISRFVLIMIQPLLVGMIAGRNPELYLSLLEQGLVELPLIQAPMVHQIPSLVFIFSLMAMAFMYYRSPSAKESGLFWTICAVYAALASSFSQPEMGFHFTSASFILLISVIEVSHAMAFRDELTGLPARRALREDLLKLGDEYCLAMLDIDHFKKFNDRHGHDVGDQVLRMVASRLAQVTGGGKAFRYGGEEFTVIFPGRYADGALAHLEDLRKEVSRSEFVVRSRMRPRKRPSNPRVRKAPPQRVSVTISIGAAWPGENAGTPDEVLKAADKALYRAKKQGRNRVST